MQIGMLKFRKPDIFPQAESYKSSCLKCQPHQNFTFYLTILTTLKRNKMLNIDRIPEVITDLESQEFLNINIIAKKYSVIYKTLKKQ